VVEREREPITPAAADEALRRFLDSGEVRTTDGGAIALEAESICVHGDGPMASAIVARVVAVLEEQGRPVLAATVADGEETPG